VDRENLTLPFISVQVSQYSEYATGWTIEKSAFDCGEGQRYFSFIAGSKLDLGPAEPLWVSEADFRSKATEE
jgi:hypothetical protein